MPGLATRGRFGFSLSGGQDLDGNGCPDLLVGAVGADKAVYIRSIIFRVIINIEINISRIIILRCVYQNIDNS